jgi:hypothetical protein
MSHAAPITNADVKALIAENAIPPGYTYTLVFISLDKRLLKDEMPARERVEILGSLEVSESDRIWLTPKTVAAIEPMDDKGNEIVRTALKLEPRNILDVYAKHFPTFAVLNPSLIAAVLPRPRECSPIPGRAGTELNKGATPARG